MVKHALNRRRTVLSKNHYIVKNVQKKIQKKQKFPYIGTWLLLDLCRKMIYKVENFPFSFFRIMFFGDNLKDKRWGGEGFFKSVYHGVDDHFFWFFSKKVVIMYYGENPLFLKIGFPMGWTIIFFWFFSKKVVIMYYGEISLFLKIGFPMGWTIIFFVFFDVKKCHHILWGKYTFWAYTRFDYLMETNIERIRDWITSRKQTFQSFKNGTH